MRKYPGYFITLEGGEGCGKTYQTPFLTEWLRQKGLSVYPTREPGGNKISERIRDILHDKENTDMHPRTETLLYQAARAQIVEKVINPRLNEGRIVLCDRFYDSTIAYQGYGHERDISEIMTLIKYATGDLVPDLTILLDLDPKIGSERKIKGNSEWNRMDSMPPEFYERVRAGYLQMAYGEPGRWIIIDGNRQPDAVFDDLKRGIEDRLMFNGFIEGGRIGPERR